MKADRSFVDQIRMQPERRAYRLESLIQQYFPTAPAELAPSADPTQSNNSRRGALERDAKIIYGRIVDAIAYTGAYKVQLERGGATIMCSDMTQTGLSVVGARQLNTYKPGDGVLLYYHPQANQGVIIGVVPDFMLSPAHALSDFVVQGGNTGLNIDYVHQFPFSLSRGGGISDWSSGRPFDGLPIGSWGAISDTGIMAFLDSYMAQFRVDEETGLFLFYRDQLARLAGHNLQIRSAGHVREDVDDEQEFDNEMCWNDKLWEARGAFALTYPIWRDYGPYDCQQVTPPYSVYEPVFDDQQPILRTRDFRGYFGQGRKNTLFLLPKNPPMQTQAYVPHLDDDDPIVPTPKAITTSVNRYQDPNEFRGVAEHNWDTDGHIAIRSAKGVIIAKRMLQPSPKRMFTPEDPSGNNQDNYASSGVYTSGGGPPHQIGDITDVGTNDQLIHAAAFMDEFAHTFNWKGLIGFVYRDRDFFTVEESDSADAAAMLDGLPDYHNLQCQQYLPRPMPTMMYVDDRYGNVLYFPNNSYLALLDDGGVLLGDGWGSEIRMTGGSIFNQCSGDIWELPGKNFNVWAGFDAIIRANNCFDVSANKGYGRIKADQNLYVLGGNEVCGGVLIESRAPGINFEVAEDLDDEQVITGVVLRAPNSIVGINASTILLTNCYTLDPGTITIDAGNQQILERATDIRRQIGQSAIDFIGTSVNEYWDNHCIIGCELDVKGPCFIQDCLMVNDNIIAEDTIAGNALSQPLTAEASIKIVKAQTTLNSRYNYLLMDFLPTAISDPTHIQDTTDFCSVEFFFRSSQTAQIIDLLLFEGRWQQIARLTSVTTVPWSERPVTHLASDTYPHPGAIAWAANLNYAEQDLALFDQPLNLCEDRGPPGPYETPAYDHPDFLVLDGNYPVIKDPCVPCP